MIHIPDSVDKELIMLVFSPIDVARILKIPLRVQAIEDFISWNYARYGTLSVRSTYHTEFDHQFGHRLVWFDGQGSVQLNSIWK